MRQFVCTFLAVVMISLTSAQNKQVKKTAAVKSSSGYNIPITITPFKMQKQCSVMNTAFIIKKVVFIA